MPRFTLVLTICGMMVSQLAVRSAWGIVRRDDRDDSLYQSLANSTCPFGGGFYDGNSGTYGSAVLISPNWILTAKHAIGGSASSFISNAGWTGISAMYGNSNYDIAVCKLSTPITTITPVNLYNADTYGSEVGNECYISGQGMTGTGSTGYNGSSWWVRRAAQSYVMCNSSDWGWGDGLLTKFRNPSTNSLTANLEGSGVEGDSGGGLYLSVNGELAVAGIQSYSWYYGTMGAYDTGAGYVRTGTSDMNNWILTYATDARVIPEPSTFVLLIGAVIFLGSMLLHRKNRKTE